MKSILVLATLMLFLAACGNNKLTLRRIQNIKKQEIVSVEEKKLNTEKTVSSTAKMDPPKQAEIETQESDKVPTTTVKDHAIKHDLPKASTPKTSENTTDNSAASDDETDEIKATALEAEKLSTYGVWSLRFSLIFLVVFIALGLFFFESIILLIGTILTFVLGLLALIFGVSSKSRSHNTELGAKQASRAIFGGIFLTIILGLILLLVISFI